MNYVAFLSVGVFAALFLVIAGHYDLENTGVHDYTPKGVVAVIKDEQRERVLIAREKHGIAVDERVIAAWEGEKLNHFASMPTPSPTAAPKAEPQFAPDAWYQWLLRAIADVFDSKRE